MSAFTFPMYWILLVFGCSFLSFLVGLIIGLRHGGMTKKAIDKAYENTQFLREMSVKMQESEKELREVLNKYKPTE